MKAQTDSIKICYIISNIDKALAFEWIAEHLDAPPFELSFILLNPGGSVLEEVLAKKKILFSRITYRGKKDLPNAIFRICRFLKSHRIQTIHCHLFDANVAGLIAGKLVGVKKRIFTRHHSTFHHQYFPRAVYYDRFINYLATGIVAISENVRRVLVEKEKANPGKIALIHHGFDLEKFQNPDADKVQKLKERYGTVGKYPVIGVIARYTEWKGLQYVIPAFAQLLGSQPDAKLLLANANGDYKPQIQHLLQQLPPGSYTEIPFEEDLYSLYGLFDIFVHVPVNPEIEAFGQTYVEALAAGVPSVFTLSGVAAEFVEDGKNAFVVPFQDSNAILRAVVHLLASSERQETIRRNGLAVAQGFGLQKMMKELSNLYTHPQ